MEIHHSKHHNAYVTKLNEALAGTGLEDKSLCEIVGDLSAVPEAKRTAVRATTEEDTPTTAFSGRSSAPPAAAPTHRPTRCRNRYAELGGFDAFKQAFANAGATRFGSGWAWLIVQADGSLAVTSTPNQDNPCMNGVAEVTGRPVIRLDVWEHAYYLKYQNLRPSYIEAFWNLVDWNAAEANYQAAK